MKTATRWLMAGALAAFALGAAAAVAAQREIRVEGSQVAQTPRAWAYEIRDGQRVPRANRVTAADGSWREELRQGTCTTVKEKTANGDYSETRKCD